MNDGGPEDLRGAGPILHDCHAEEGGPPFAQIIGGLGSRDARAMVKPSPDFRVCPVGGAREDYLTRDTGRVGRASFRPLPMSARCHLTD